MIRTSNLFDAGKEDKVKLNLYKITQKENNGYETFDSAIVIASTMQEAQHIHVKMAQSMEDGFSEEENIKLWKSWNDSWASAPEHVEVEHIGVANPGRKKGIVLASFNAG